MKSLLSATLKTLRKEYGLTQEDLALKCGVGLNFVRQLEQGKPTLRMDKVNQVLAIEVDQAWFIVHFNFIDTLF